MVTLTKYETSAPQRLKMRYEDYLTYIGEDKIVEWVNGEGIIYMPPTDRHQELSLFLSELLHLFISFFNLGSLRYAPLEVKLWPDGPSREPDIIFVRSENRAKLTPQRVEGAPDLLIEIISPGSVTEDRVHKFTEYERAGVGEYWLIDPRPRQQQADFYVLGQDQRYYPAPVTAEGRYQAHLIPNFWFQLEWLWQDPLPDPQLALAEIMMSLETLPAEAKEVYRALYQLLSDKK